MTKTKFLNIRLTPDLRKRVTAEATRTGRTLAGMVNLLLERGLTVDVREDRP